MAWSWGYIAAINIKNGESSQGVSPSEQITQIQLNGGYIVLIIEIPGVSRLELSHLVLDYNGTIAKDGGILTGVEELITLLRTDLEVHILTADTHGTVRKLLTDIPCTLHIIREDGQDQAKAEYIKELGSKGVVAVGNGRNDSLMLKESALGIAVIQAEGAAGAALREAAVICTSIHDALNLLVKPARLQATLRN